MVGDARLDLRPVVLVLPLAIAGVGVGPFAFGIGIAGKDDELAVGREVAAVRAAPEVRQLERVAACCEIKEPELAVAHDEERVAVGREARVLTLAVAGELPCGAACHRHEPDVLLVAVLLDALLADGDRDQAPVGRDLHVVEAPRLEQLLGRERARGKGRGSKGNEGEDDTHAALLR